MDLIYIIVICTLVILLTNKKNPGDDYDRGFRAGWGALAGQIHDLMNSHQLSKESINSLLTDTPATIAAPVTPTEHVQSRTVKKANDKKARSIRNTNVVLYLASFLLVAAGAAFIAASVADIVKLFGVWLLVIGFYGTGLVLHAAIPKLKPAAVAFTGTGLALLPFAGVAIHQYGGISSESSWMVTSFIGVLAYYWAAVRLKSAVVSYLTLAFVISLVSSSVATASLPIIWNFTSIIVVSLIASLVSHIRPTWLPAVFRQPVELTGQVVTPIVLVSSLFVSRDLYIRGYEIVFAVATAHYIVAWLQSRNDIYENAARVIGHVALLIFGWDIVAENSTLFGYWFIGLASAQIVYTLLRRRMGYEVWLWAALGLQFFANMFWIGQEQSMTHISYGLTILGISSFIVGYLLRYVPYAIPGLGVTILLPLTIMRGAIEPSLDWGWLVGWYLYAATATLYIFRRWVFKRSEQLRLFTSGAFISYTMMAATLSLMLGNYGGATAMAVVVALLFAGSYVLNVPEAVFVAALGMVISVFRLGIFLKWESEWLMLNVASIVTIALFAISWIMLAVSDERRRPYVLYSGWAVGAIGILSSLYSGNNSVALSAALLLVAVSISVVLEGRRSDSVDLQEIGAYLTTFGLQRMTSIWVPELNLVFYAHWWALTIALLAAARKLYVPRLIIATAILTAVTGVFALSEGDSYSLLFLIEHIALVIIGASTSTNWAIWWGITASSLAILYFLRDIAYLAFGFLGLLLIGFVISRLLKSNSSDHSK